MILIKKTRKKFLKSEIIRYITIFEKNIKSKNNNNIIRNICNLSSQGHENCIIF